VSELHPVKQQQRAFWTVGDYATFAGRLQPAADALVARLDIGPGQDVLDVATGTGNAAITAAAAGATVTGLDLTPELFDVARQRADAADVQIEWVPGDAEQLPFPDASFDRVLSVFGAMFAPDQQKTAAELVRVCRPGGTIGVASWTPQGLFGQMVMLLTLRSPQPPPPDFKPPALWGLEDYVGGLFDGLGVELAFERGSIVFDQDSPDAWVTELERDFGPTILLKQALAPSGGWEALRADLVDVFVRANVSTTNFQAPAEYLTTIARR
jgi:SAM-dependent methyltransferase